MIQIRYRIPKGYRPSRVCLRVWREVWIRTGANPDGVRIDAMDWRKGGTQKQIRARLRKYIGKDTVAGIVEHYADSRMTYCDFDRSRVRAESRVWAVSRLIRSRPEWIQFRRTSRGWHVVTRWRAPMPPLAIVALQAILGSDPFREAFNLSRAMTGKTRGGRWNLLFKEKIR